MNRKGLKPRKMRHRIKAEDSNDESEEEDDTTNFDDEDSEFGNDLMDGD